jgi:transcriptional regulator with XRE-family HTH domain
MTFGQTLKTAREKMEKSQEEAAKAIRDRYNVRISGPYLSMLENDVKTNPTIELVDAILNYYQLPVEAILSLFKTTESKVGSSLDATDPNFNALSFDLADISPEEAEAFALIRKTWSKLTPEQRQKRLDVLKNFTKLTDEGE